MVIFFFFFLIIINYYMEFVRNVFTRLIARAWPAPEVEHYYGYYYYYFLLLLWFWAGRREGEWWRFNATSLRKRRSSFERLPQSIYNIIRRIRRWPRSERHHPRGLSVSCFFHNFFSHRLILFMTTTFASLERYR